MRDATRRKLAAGERVRAFLQAHPLSHPGQSALLCELEKRLAETEVLLAQQIEGIHKEHEAVAQRRAIRRSIHTELLPYLVSVGQRPLRSQPRLVEGFQRPRKNASERDFIEGTKSLLAVALRERGRFVAAGLAEEVLEELGLRMQQYEEAAGVVMCSHKRHVNASAAIETKVSQIGQTLGLLDEVNRYRFRDAPELLAEWRWALNGTISQHSEAKPEKAA